MPEKVYSFWSYGNLSCDTSSHAGLKIILPVMPAVDRYVICGIFASWNNCGKKDQPDIYNCTCLLKCDCS